MRYDLESWNIVPIEATAETFFTALQEEVRPELQRGDQPWMRASRSPETIRFAQQFRQLTAESEQSVDTTHDLYRGEPPVWADVLNDLDARQGWSNELAASALRASRSQTQTVHVAVGPRLSGKSTGLLRVAQVLDAAQLHVFLFRSEYTVIGPRGARDGL